MFHYSFLHTYVVGLKAKMVTGTLKSGRLCESAVSVKYLSVDRLVLRKFTYQLGG